MNQRGYSLTELLVVVAVLGFILAGIVALQQAGMFAYLMGSNRVEAQQNARVAIAVMTREMRAACAVTSLSSTAMTFTMVDPTRANLVDCGSTTPSDIITVRYALSGASLYRDLAVPPAALPALGSGQVLIGGVDALALTGYDSVNATTTTPGASCASGVICSVEISVRTKSEESVASYAPGNVRANLADRVRLRNL